MLHQLKFPQIHYFLEMLKYPHILLASYQPFLTTTAPDGTISKNQFARQSTCKTDSGFPSSLR